MPAHQLECPAGPDKNFFAKQAPNLSEGNQLHPVREGKVLAQGDAGTGPVFRLWKKAKQATGVFGGVYLPGARKGYRGFKPDKQPVSLECKQWAVWRRRQENPSFLLSGWSRGYTNKRIPLFARKCRAGKREGAARFAAPVSFQ